MKYYSLYRFVPYILLLSSCFNSIQIESNETAVSPEPTSSEHSLKNEFRKQNTIYLEKSFSRLDYFYNYKNQDFNISRNDSSIYIKLNEIKNRILDRSNIKHREVFEWNIVLLKNKNFSIRAFGDYIYIGLKWIKSITSEDLIAGILAHAISHIDKRHKYRYEIQHYPKKIKSKMLEIYHKLSTSETFGKFLNTNPSLIPQLKEVLEYMRHKKHGMNCYRKYKIEVMANLKALEYLKSSDYNHTIYKKFYKTKQPILIR